MYHSLENFARAKLVGSLCPVALGELPMLTIRQAVAADAELIHLLISELARYEKEEAAVKVSAADLAAQLGSAQCPFECFIAEADGVAAGFALYFFTYSTWEGTRTLYLEDLFVRPQFRGEKVGLALMQALASRAEQQNCARFEWSVLDWNQLAISFYDRIGAAPVDGWTRYRMSGESLHTLARTSA